MTPTVLKRMIWLAFAASCGGGTTSAPPGGNGSEAGQPEPDAAQGDRSAPASDGPRSPDRMSTADAGADHTPPPPPPGDAGPPPSGQPVFVVAGYGALRAVSRDRGRTWVDLIQEVPNGGDDRYLLRGIGCGNGLCVAGGGTAGATGRLLTTADGKTWAMAQTGQPGISDVAFGNGVWVGVSGSYGVRSLDGSKWDVNTDKGMLQVPDAILRRIRFCGRRFVAWGDRGKCYSSEDGLKWDACVRQGEWTEIAYGAGQCVAAGARRQTSTDGITWQQQEPMGSTWIVWAGDKFAAGSSGRTMFSPDGNTWTSMPGNPPDELVIYGAGTFVSPDAWSEDGARWTRSQRPASMNGAADIDFTYF
jgi:hypothetical protein